jgi:hypothetical protein
MAYGNSARISAILAAVAVGALAGGCASEGDVLGGANLTTASVGSPQAQARPAIDPACVQLAARIDALRQEGFVARVEKAAQGKSSTVSVKRASLAKMTELDKANAEFQAKCSNLGSAQTAAAQTAPATAGASPAADAVPAQVAKAPAGQAAAAGAATP